MAFNMKYFMEFSLKRRKNYEKTMIKLSIKKILYIESILKSQSLTSGFFDIPWGKTSYSTPFESFHKWSIPLELNCHIYPCLILR